MHTGVKLERENAVLKGMLYVLALRQETESGVGLGIATELIAHMADRIQTDRASVEVREVDGLTIINTQ